MKELIKVTANEEGQQLVSGRELYEVLGINSNFSTWIKRMIEYGFIENVDYTTVWYDSKNGIVNFKGSAQSMTRQGYSINYILTLEMAKHIAMVQRTEIGMQVRNYFLECEKIAKQKIVETKPHELTKEQYNVLALYDMGGQKAVEIALEIKQAGIETGIVLGKEQGLKYLCQDGLVTIPSIMNYIKDEYADKFVYNTEISSTEWSKYLRYMGYLETKRFPRKDGGGMERMASYQPTKLFEDVMVNQGMAVVSEIDDRKKKRITYTVEIEKFLLSDMFKKSFFDYLDKFYPRGEDEEVA